MEPLLCMRNISKHYPGVVALDRVDYDLNAGEVHCLVGENGAGKSTLMKILGGAVSMDDGSILLEGRPVIIDSPSAAQRLGIGVIYQDFKLVNDLSVAENIFLGQEPLRGNGTILDKNVMHQGAREVLSRLNETFDTHAAVGSLGAAQRQIVEIAKSLIRKVRILVMDEPTASLSEQEMSVLFEIIRTLKNRQVGIVYISHRLDEIFQIADRVTVLRDGKKIRTSPVAELDRRTLIRLMVGRELEQEYPKVSLQRGEEILRIGRLQGSRIKDVNLRVHHGEIFGIAGLVGAGRSELAHMIFGAEPRLGGTILLDGDEYDPASPRDAIDAGVGLLTEDRNRYGLLTQMNVRENVSLSNLRDVLGRVTIDKIRETSVAEGYIDQLRIKTPSTETMVENLSGGNRQKVVLARWLFTRSRLLLFDEPTAGIDVGAKFEIYNLLNDLAARGIGIIIISSELQELLGMCDRIAVMCEGRITGVLSKEEASQEKIMALATQFLQEPARAN